jgi:hypothetical protein
MQVHIFRVPSELDQPYRRLLMSDLHYGHPNVDKKRIRSDLDAARNVGARVFINGDVFDAIGKKDKRYAKSQQDAALRDQDDMTRAVVKLAATELEPYADLIDVIGVGNHEEAFIRHCDTDLVGLLIDRLNATLAGQGSEHRIRHGGIAGFVRTKFLFSRPNVHDSSVSHDLLYHHGTGGDAPVTKGAIDANRRLTNYDYDAYTFGHKHNKTEGEDTFMFLSRNGRIRHRERIYIQTGSYLWNYKRTTQANPLGYSYAESGQHAPKPLGGKFLVLKPTRITHNDPKRGTRPDTWSEYRVDQGGIKPELIG